MKVIDLLNKIENCELEENTKFYDKYVKKEYIYKPQSYAGIYPEGKAFADEDWFLTLHSGSFRLSQEVEIVEDTPKEDKVSAKDFLDNQVKGLYPKAAKKIEKLGNSYIKEIGDEKFISDLFSTSERIIIDKINEIIEVINERNI